MIAIINFEGKKMTRGWDESTIHHYKRAMENRTTSCFDWRPAEKKKGEAVIKGPWGWLYALRSWKSESQIKWIIHFYLFLLLDDSIIISFG